MATCAAITTSSAGKKQKRKKWLPQLIQPHGIFLPPKNLFVYTHKQYECTERLPTQCKHVQLIGDESLVISRSAYWLDRFLYRRQVCDARGICIKCVRIELHTRTQTHSHTIEPHAPTKISLASISFPDGGVFGRFHLFNLFPCFISSISTHYVAFGSTPISITRFIMVQKRREDEDHDEQTREAKELQERKKLGMDTCTHIVFIGSEFRFENASNVRNRIWNHVFWLGTVSIPAPSYLAHNFSDDLWACFQFLHVNIGVSFCEIALFHFSPALRSFSRLFLLPCLA